MGAYNRVVGIKDDEITDYSITEALAMKKSMDPKLGVISKTISL